MEEKQNKSQQFKFYLIDDGPKSEYYRENLQV